MKKNVRKNFADKKGIRPTSGLALGALFNSLVSAGYLPGGTFLDLFAGTGTVSLEALRRGALSVTAVETDAETAEFVRAALQANVDRASVMRGDVRRVVPRLASAGKSYTVIFADPPYYEGWSKELPALIEQSPSIVGEDGIFVMERSIREETADISGFEREDRRYGETALSFYRRAAQPNTEQEED